MDKGSGLRILGAILLAVSGVIALINFGAMGQIPGSSPLNIGYLFNLFFVAIPIGLVGFFIYLGGRNVGKQDKGSDYARKQDKIRPLL